MLNEYPKLLTFVYAHTHTHTHTYTHTHIYIYIEREGERNREREREIIEHQIEFFGHLMEQSSIVWFRREQRQRQRENKNLSFFGGGLSIYLFIHFYSLRPLTSAPALGMLVGCLGFIAN